MSNVSKSCQFFVLELKRVVHVSKMSFNSLKLLFLASIFTVLMLKERRILADGQDQKTVAKRDEVFYSKVESVKNSYSVEGDGKSRRSAEDEENQGEITDDGMMYYGSFYPMDTNTKGYELHYPENPPYEEWYGPFEPPEEYENQGEWYEGNGYYKRSLDFLGPRGGRSVYYGPRGGRSLENEAGPRGGRSLNDEVIGPRGGRTIGNAQGPRGGRSVENDGPRGGRSVDTLAKGRLGVEDSEEKKSTTRTVKKSDTSSINGQRGGRDIKADVAPGGGRGVSDSKTTDDVNNGAPGRRDARSASGPRGGRDASERDSRERRARSVLDFLGPRGGRSIEFGPRGGRSTIFESPILWDERAFDYGPRGGRYIDYVLWRRSLETPPRDRRDIIFGPRGGRGILSGPRGGRAIDYGPRGGRSLEGYCSRCARSINFAEYGPRGGRSIEMGPRGGRSVDFGPRGGRSLSEGPRGGRSLLFNTFAFSGPRGGRSVNYDLYEGPRGGRAIDERELSRAFGNEGAVYYYGPRGGRSVYGETGPRGGREIEYTGPRGGRAVIYGPRGGRAIFSGPRGGRDISGPRGGRNIESGPRGGRSTKSDFGPRGGRSILSESAMWSKTGPRGGRSLESSDILGPRGGRSTVESSATEKREATSSVEEQTITNEKVRKERDTNVDMEKIDKKLKKSN